MPTKVQTAIQTLNESSYVVTRELPPPSPRDVLRGLDAGELKQYKSALIDSGIKRATANRTIERQRAGEGRQQRGATKGLSAKYADPLKALFPDKFKGKTKTSVHFPSASIDVDAKFKTSSN